MYPSETLFKEFNVLDVRQLFILHILTYLRHHPDITQKRRHQYLTRTKDTHLLPPKRLKTLGQRHATYISVKIYNLLPDLLKNVTNDKTFHRQLTDWLIHTGINHTATLLKTALH